MWLLYSEWAIFSQCRVVVTFAVSKKMHDLDGFPRNRRAEVKLTVYILCATLPLKIDTPIVLTPLGLGGEVMFGGAIPPHMQTYNENAATFQAPKPTFEANRQRL